MMAIQRVAIPIAIAGIVLMAQPLQADESADLGLAYARAQAENQDQLKLYRWNTSTTMKKEGETKFEMKVSNRLNENGELVQELEDSESSEKQKRGRRGRKQQQAAEELDELLKKTVKVIGSYVFMTKGMEVDFFDKAKITEGEDDMAGLKKVTASNVSVEGDVLTKWIDPDALQTKRIEFAFTIDEHAIKGEVMYRPMEDGPNVPRLATIKIADMDAVIETEYLDYSKQL
jgi:hypothetical protein